MRALIVLGGNEPENMLLISCAGYADLKIAVDKGYEAFDRAGIMPNLLVGDMDSVSSEALERAQKSTQIERLPCQRTIPTACMRWM